MLCLPTSLTPNDVTLEIGRSSVPIIKQTTFHGFFLNAGSAKNIKTLTPPYMTNPSFFPDPQTKIKKKKFLYRLGQNYTKKILLFWSQVTFHSRYIHQLQSLCLPNSRASYSINQRERDPQVFDYNSKQKCNSISNKSSPYTTQLTVV